MGNFNYFIVILALLIYIIILEVLYMNYNQLKTALSSTYRNNNTAEKDLKGKGFTLDKELSGKRAKVFVDDKTGQAYVAHRGTNSIQDVFTDAGLLLGIKDGKRLRHAKPVKNKQK